MSSEEKRKRDRHQKMRKFWSIVFLTEIILCAIGLAGLLYVNYESSKLVNTNYSETSTVEYKVNLDSNDMWDEVESGRAYPSDILNSINYDLKYVLDMESKEVDFSYDYTISKYIEYTSRTHGTYEPVLIEDDVTESGTLNSSSKLVIEKSIAVSFASANNAAIVYVEGRDLTAFLCVEVNIKVKSTCADFLESNNDTYRFLIKTQLADSSTSIQNLSDASGAGQTIACTKASAVATATKNAIIPTAAVLLTSILIFIIFLGCTKNKDVDYANKISSILRSYKSFIQVSLTEFSVNGYYVVKIRSLVEMLQIRDTLQKPVIMHENEDKTCSHFFIIDNEVMYMFGICVEGYEELLEVTPKEERERKPEVIYVKEVVASKEEVNEAPVVEEVVEEQEVQEEVVEEATEEAEDDSKQLDLCSYTFEAKLILAEPEMKEFHNEIVNYALSYGLKVVRSAKRERIYLGRKLYANLTFSGKKLVVAMALDPNQYVDSKYKFKDMSEVKKYAETPFVMKVTSGLKVRQIKDLLTTMFVEDGLENQHLDVEVEKIPNKSKKQLIKEGLVKVNTKTIK